MTFNRVVFELTNRCNLNCRHCLRDKPGQPQDLDLAVLDKVLGQARQAYGVQFVAFTGGEPLIYPKLEDMLNLVVKHDYFFSLVTNGHLLRKRIKLLTRPEFKKKLGDICLSLDGHTEEIHDRIRGPGAFRKAMAAMILIKNAGIPVVIKHSVGRHNFEQLEQAILSFVHLKADRLEIAHTYPTPDNVEAGLMLDPPQCREVESTVYRMARELRVPITMTAGVFSPQKFFSCSSLDMADLYINVDGWLCVCCMLPGIRGWDRNKPEPDLVANLSKVDLWDGHRKLIDAINKLQQARLDRIGRGDLIETDNFQCISCARYFHKLDWLDNRPDNPWSVGYDGKEIPP